MAQLVEAHTLLTAAAAAISCGRVSKKLVDLSETDMALLGSRGLRGAHFMRELDVPPAVARDRAIWAHQRSALMQLLHEAEKRSIPLHLFKGADICERYFGSTPLCTKGDVDVLVPKPVEFTARALLADLGYIQADFDTNTRQLVPCTCEVLDKHERNNYSLKSFVRLEDIDWSGRATEPVGYSRPTMNTEERCQLLMTVDIATGLDSTIDCVPLFERAIPSAFGIGKTLSPEDHYWYLCSLFYLNLFQFKSKARLGHLCEIGVLLAAEHKTLDWNYLARVAKLYDLYSPLFYLTSFLSELADLGLGREVLDMLDPRNGTRSRDFGWQIPKALGMLDPFPADLLPRGESLTRAEWMAS